MKKQYNGVSCGVIHEKISSKFNLLVDEILSYESDTFSSEASGITPSEAEKIAFTFIIRDIEWRASSVTMDGGMLRAELEELRGG